VLLRRTGNAAMEQCSLFHCRYFNRVLSANLPSVIKWRLSYAEIHFGHSETHSE